VGSPSEIRRTIDGILDASGGFEHASMQVNFVTLPFDEARRSMNLFSAEVMPHYMTRRHTA